MLQQDPCCTPINKRLFISIPKFHKCLAQYSSLGLITQCCALQHTFHQKSLNPNLFAHSQCLLFWTRGSRTGICLPALEHKLSFKYKHTFQLHSLPYVIYLVFTGYAIVCKLGFRKDKSCTEDKETQLPNLIQNCYFTLCNPKLGHIRLFINNCPQEP